MNNFKDITLLIPTHNRHFYLERILKYYSDVDIKIIVADSSLKPFEKLNLFTKIRYEYFPHKDLNEKLFLVHKFVDTKYLVLCADDDFIVPAAITTCIEFLDKNEDYFGVCGNIVGVTINDKMPVYLLQCETTGNIELTLDSNDPLERLKKICNSYSPSMYCVHRKDALLPVLGEALSISNYNLMEYLIEWNAVLHGKYKELPIFYQIRTSDVNVTSASSTTDDFDKMQDNSSNTMQKKAFIDFLSIKLQKIYKINQEQAKEEIIHAIELFMGWRNQIASKYKISKYNQLKNILLTIPVVSFFLEIVLNIKHKNIYKANNKRIIEKCNQLNGFPFKYGSTENIALNKILKTIFES
jgi:glycosyltransferase domain-containing protein